MLQKKELLFIMVSGHVGAFRSTHVRATEDLFTKSLQRLLFGIVKKNHIPERVIVKMSPRLSTSASLSGI